MSEFEIAEYKNIGAGFKRRNMFAASRSSISVVLLAKIPLVFDCLETRVIFAKMPHPNFFPPAAGFFNVSTSFLDVSALFEIFFGLRPISDDQKQGGFLLEIPLMAS